MILDIDLLGPLQYVMAKSFKNDALRTVKTNAVSISALRQPCRTLNPKTLN